MFQRVSDWLPNDAPSTPEVPQWKQAMNLAMAFGVILVPLLAVGGCTWLVFFSGNDDPLADLPPIDQTEEVSSSTFSSTWPLTVDRGEIRCDWLSGGGNAASFTAPDGRRYGLNGSARAQLGLPRIDPIWKDDPTNPGVKVNASDLLDAALALC